jgi:hypothetical protein
MPASKSLLASALGKEGLSYGLQGPTVGQASYLFTYLILLLHWGYIVTFTKFLTMYHSWIHPLHPRLLWYALSFAPLFSPGRQPGPVTPFSLLMYPILLRQKHVQLQYPWTGSCADKWPQGPTLASGCKLSLRGTFREATNSTQQAVFPGSKVTCGCGVPCVPWFLDTMSKIKALPHAAKESQRVSWKITRSDLLGKRNYTSRCEVCSLGRDWLVEALGAWGFS